MKNPICKEVLRDIQHGEMDGSCVAQFRHIHDHIAYDSPLYAK